MRRHIINILILALLTLAFGCTSVNRIQKNMNKYMYSMAYEQDSIVAKPKYGISVFVDTVLFNPGLMNDTTIVTREKGWFLPLVFVYIWDSQNTCTQGKKIIADDIPSFCKAAFVQEINRSGSFFSDTLQNSDYSIELSIDEIKTEGPYISKGFFYFIVFATGFSYADRAGPALSTLSISYKLKKGLDVVHCNSFKSEQFTQTMSKLYITVDGLQQDYAETMVMALSANFRNVIELIVDDLNTYFDSQRK